MLLLDGAGRTHHRLKRWEPHQFSGETTIRAELPDGPTRDFNLMVRRGAGTGRLTVQTAPQTLILEPGHRYLHCAAGSFGVAPADGQRSEEHASELQSLMRTSYGVFCLNKKRTAND